MLESIHSVRKTTGTTKQQIRDHGAKLLDRLNLLKGITDEHMFRTMLTRPLVMVHLLRLDGDNNFENCMLHELSHFSANHEGWRNNKVGAEKNLCKDWVSKSASMND